MKDQSAEAARRDGGAEEQESRTPEKKSAQSATQVPDETGYRSQKDVDAAFKKRMSALREKWESEQKEEAKNRGDEKRAEQMMRQIEQGAQDFFNTYPDVDIAALVGEDPLFAYLLSKGKGLTETYAFLYEDAASLRLRKRMEQEILDNLKARNLRPHVLPAANSGGTDRDIARLSDAEILRIDSRIKNGERVTL